MPHACLQREGGGREGFEACGSDSYLMERRLCELPRQSLGLPELHPLVGLSASPLHLFLCCAEEGLGMCKSRRQHGGCCGGFLGLLAHFHLAAQRDEVRTREAGSATSKEDRLQVVPHGAVQTGSLLVHARPRWPFRGRTSWAQTTLASCLPAKRGMGRKRMRGLQACDSDPALRVIRPRGHIKHTFSRHDSMALS